MLERSSESWKVAGGQTMPMATATLAVNASPAAYFLGRCGALAAAVAVGHPSLPLPELTAFYFVSSCYLPNALAAITLSVCQ